ncbi:hypothetical protein DdX_06855 [Ditylenchus destructor]|uniref:Uncharacterized protein n=1 Tax=Ditylenchus destructor TaxID=166010 RepID=A0AAD4NAE1_9BILA|nr:hypothetical protein DdX_06855 [Ditylenchus destructor]
MDSASSRRSNSLSKSPSKASTRSSQSTVRSSLSSTDSRHVAFIPSERSNRSTRRGSMSDKRTTFRDKVQYTPYPLEGRSLSKNRNEPLHRIARNTPFKLSRESHTSATHRSNPRLRVPQFSIGSKSSTSDSSSCLRAINRLISKNKGRITLEYLRVSTSPESSNSQETRDDTHNRQHRRSRLSSANSPSQHEILQHVTSDSDDPPSNRSSRMLHNEVMRRGGGNIQYSGVRASSISVPRSKINFWDENSNWDDIQSPIGTPEQRMKQPQAMTSRAGNELYFGGPEHRRWLTAVYGRSKKLPHFRRKIRVTGLFSSQLNRFRDSTNRTDSEQGTHDQMAFTMDPTNAESASDHQDDAIEGASNGMNDHHELTASVDSNAGQEHYGHKFDVGMRMLLDKTTKDVNFKVSFKSKSKTPKVDVMAITIDGNPIWRRKKLQSSGK